MERKYQLGPTPGELARTIEVHQTTLPGVLKIKRSITPDHRGYYGELYNTNIYRAHGITVEFIEQNGSFSIKGTLRGLHGDSKTWKLITCLYGEIYLVVLNYNPASEYFGKWEAFTLTPENSWQVLIPPRYCNGHLVMSDHALFHYNQSQHYSGPEIQNVIKWDDPRFSIKWPPIPTETGIPILSHRDKYGISYTPRKI